MLQIYTANQKKPGDVVWAFEYRGELETRGRLLRQEPVKGMLLSKKYPEGDNSHVAPHLPAKYFVPFGKYDAPMWSKTIMAEHRHYADDEETAIKGYNMAVKTIADAHRMKVAEIWADLIPDEANHTIADEFALTDMCYRTDVAVYPEEVYDAVKDHLQTLRDTDPGDTMTWESFAQSVEDRCITSYDGFGKFLLGDKVVDNATIWIPSRIVIIYDKFMIPFNRIPVLFKNNNPKVRWYNK